MPTSERARDRETKKYHQAWLEKISRDNRLLNDTDIPRHEATGEFPRDKVLIAFAQLGCLRLDVKRGIVTLVSSSSCHILAGATRFSLLSSGQDANLDKLTRGLCENALNPPLYTAKSCDGQSYTAPALVINDIPVVECSSRDECASSRTSFYAGVPIMSKSGFAIGVYGVVDDKMREGLGIEELQFMHDIATTVMDHLENISNDTTRRRGERMVLGLGAFTEGQTSMDPDTKDVNSTMPAVETCTQTSPTTTHQTILKGITVGGQDPSGLEGFMKREGSPDGERLGATKLTTTETLNGEDFNHSQVVRKSVELAAASSDPSSNLVADISTTGGSVEESPALLAPTIKSSVPLEIRQTFARAANILRQATTSDGVMFFDAQSANVGESYKATPAFFRSESNDLSTSSDDSVPGPGGSSDDTGEHETGYFTRSNLEPEMQPGRRKQSKQKDCQRLGYSFSLSSVENMNSQDAFVLKEDELRRFIRRYPKGLVMHFTEDGEISSSDDSIMSRSEMTPHQKASKRMIASELLRLVNNARSIIWLPLWDFGRARWSAGCFVWSSRPERLLHAQEDLVYMKAFANTVMFDIQRVEAVVSDQAKTSFVANISHELRSPLHGILGSIEFLQDTAVDPYQASMINTVETCGKTLLDTVNHVLDFAKLSKWSQKRSARVGGKGTTDPAPSDLEMDVNLATIVEEVVESIYAGQTFRSTGAFHGNEDEGATSPLIDGPSTRPPLSRTQSKFAGAVRLLLDIERIDSWVVRTQPGAVRRIVMNLLGNALKYTEKGLVCVSLHSTKSSGSSSRLGFCITVADTGKGMSTDFAKNHAWEAFSQEDSFANGVGLGLSIVRHITSSIGGKIDMRSSQGKGTELNVLLTAPLSKAPPDDSQDIIKFVSHRVKGLKVCILNPGQSTVDGPKADLNRRAEDTFGRLATSWFGMDVFRADSISGVEADFFIYILTPSAEHMLQKHGVGASNAHVPLIVITSNAYESANLRKETQQLKEMGRMIDVISQPCGPRKLARAFERCIYREPFITPSDIANTSLAVMRIDKDHGAFNSQDRDILPFDSGERAEPKALLLLRTESAPSNVDLSATTETMSESMGASTFSGTSMNCFPPSVPSTFNGNEVLRPVLLVDDNEVNLKLLVAFVRKAGYPYTAAGNGLQALNLYKEASKDPQSAFRAVVIDIQMPVMDGFTATKHIRSYEQKMRLNPPAIVLALTGLASKASQHEAFEAGVNHFLPKPVKFKEFLKLLQQ